MKNKKLINLYINNKFVIIFKIIYKLNLSFSHKLNYSC